jgi:hypothetical protein
MKQLQTLLIPYPKRFSKKSMLEPYNFDFSVIDSVKLYYNPTKHKTIYLVPPPIGMNKTSGGNKMTPEIIFNNKTSITFEDIFHSILDEKIDTIIQEFYDNTKVNSSYSSEIKGEVE